MATQIELVCKEIREVQTEGIGAWVGSSLYETPADDNEKAAQFIQWLDAWVVTHVQPTDSQRAADFHALDTRGSLSAALDDRLEVLERA